MEDDASTCQSTSLNPNNNGINRSGIEENILAILDAPGSKDTQDANDDRFAFLEAVRAASLVPGSGTPPTNKLYEEVFRIMRVGKSLELIMESYCLLNDLDQRFPRVCVSDSSELVVVEEAWSPFVFKSNFVPCERQADGKGFSGPLDSTGFHQLIEDLADITSKIDSQAIEIKSLRYMLLFQYLVNVLEGDFIPRNRVYKETTNWSVLRESVLTMLLSSRRINYKTLMKDCLLLLCGMHQVSAGTDVESSTNCVAKSSENDRTAAALALVEVGYTTCKAMETLLTTIMELDLSRKKADEEGLITRADGVRTPLIEIILDELTYNKDFVSPFLQVFNAPQWKLEIIIQYFAKYTSKPSVRTRRSNDPTEDPTFSWILGYFSNTNSTRSITKKISSGVVQVLLAHAFQAHLSISSCDISNIKDEVESSCREDICKSMITAFSTLRQTDGKMEILPIGKEALFTAATVLSTRS